MTTRVEDMTVEEFLSRKARSVEDVGAFKQTYARLSSLTVKISVD